MNSAYEAIIDAGCNASGHDVVSNSSIVILYHIEQICK